MPRKMLSFAAAQAALEQFPSDKQACDGGRPFGTKAEFAEVLASSFDHHAWVGHVEKFGLRSEIYPDSKWPSGGQMVDLKAVLNVLSRQIRLL